MHSFKTGWLLICQLLVFVEGPIEKSSKNAIPMFNHVVGEDALLSCDIADADWAYIRLSKAMAQIDISSQGTLVSKWEGKYSIRLASNDSTLIVNNSSYEDAGIYCCWKDWDFHYVHLVIKESSQTFGESAQIATVPSTSVVVTDLHTCDNDDSRLIVSIVFNVIGFALAIVFAVLYVRLYCERRTMRRNSHREEEIVALNVVDQNHSDLPVTPTSLVVSEVNSSSVKLTWNSCNYDSVISFSIQCKQKNIEGVTFVEIHGVTGTEYTVLGLNVHTVYEFRVTAVNAAGRSPPSSPLDVTTRELVDCSNAEHSDKTLSLAGPDETPVVVRTVSSKNSVVTCFVKLDGRLFVVNRDTKKIIVSNDSGDDIGSIDIPELNLPAAFTSSERHWCLYLSDRERNRVWSIKLQEPVEKSEVKIWKQFKNTHVNAQMMSVTHDDRLLILIAIGLWDTKSWRGSINIYEHQNAKRELEVPVPRKFFNPWSALLTKKNTLLLSYGLHNHNLFGAGVCELDTNGSVLRHCEHVNFYIPVSIVANSSLDEIFVIDMLNCRVILLETETLKVRGVVLQLHRTDVNVAHITDDDIPTRLCYDAQNDELIVGFLNGRVKIYKNRITSHAGMHMISSMTQQV